MAGKVRKEDLAHQRLILRVNGHALVIVIDMVNRVKLVIIVDKDGFNKSSSKSMLSISSENGEREICCKALLIASFSKFCGVKGFLQSTCIPNLLGKAPLTAVCCENDPLCLSLQEGRGGESTPPYLLTREIILSLYLCGVVTDLSLYRRGEESILSLSLW